MPLEGNDHPMRLYWDHNATSPMRPSVLSCLEDAWQACGNPSSIHGEGRGACGRLEAARETVARALGVTPSMVTFTSGGTESNHLALAGLSASYYLVSALEHPCVRDLVPRLGKPWAEIPALLDGQIDLGALEDLLKKYGAGGCVSVMHANNETGVLQPILEAADLIHAHGGVLHVDAAQTIGRFPVRFPLLGADIVTASAHKCGGPMGVGIVVKAPSVSLSPLFVGGGQEGRLRAGTENVPAISAFAEVFKEDLDLEFRKIAEIRDGLEARLYASFQGVRIFGQGSPRISNTSCFALEGRASETMVMAFDLEGVALSAGAACSSGKVSRSKVLEAMGVEPDWAACALRISLGWSTRPEEVDRFIEACERVL